MSELKRSVVIASKMSSHINTSIQAHYDLAVGVALWWLENEDIKSPVENEFM